MAAHYPERQGRIPVAATHPVRQADGGDYDHLARVKEWSAAGEAEGDGE